MGDYRSFHRSFAGGEVTREFFGQIADRGFQTGLSLCRNFMVMPHGPIANRPGTRFVREVKHSGRATRVIPFYFSFDQTLCLEFGHLYFRFHTLGQTVLQGAPSAWATSTAYAVGDMATNGGTTYYCTTAHTSDAASFATDAANWYAMPGGLYEVPHPYTEAQLADVQFVQSGDVITFVHPEHPPRELRRYGATNWVLETILFQPILSPPNSLTGAATAGDTPGTPFDTLYVVTALTATSDESLQSASVTVSNNLYDDGAYNTLSWDAAVGAERYNVYKRSAGLYGYIGQTDAVTFRDENIAPDPGRTPPIDITVFDSADNYPRAVGYFDQRRGFASTFNQPQNIWLSKSGTESNFNFSIPNQDADSLQFKIAARGGDQILHMVPMNDLILTTAAGIWRVSGGVTDLLLPDTFNARQQVNIGSSKVDPVLAGSMIYVAANGGHVREFGYSGQSEGYRSGDLSIRAPHLFDDKDIVRLSFSLTPWPIVWAVSTSGNLLGFTYVPEQQIGAWHQHETLGDFEDIATVVENRQSVNYLVVKRTIDGIDVRYIEYLEPLLTRQFSSPEEQYFVDCGATYRPESPTDTVTGLSWLEGETVSILADGSVCPPQVVTGGEVSLPVEASVIHVGLPYAADAETLPLVFEVPGYAQGMSKNVNQVFLSVYRSSGIFVGPSFDDLTQYKQRTIEPLGSPPELKSETIDVVIQPQWDSEGTVCIRQAEPLALTILSMALDVALGGG